MDGPQLFRTETDSSNEDTRLEVPSRLPIHSYGHRGQGTLSRSTVSQSSSADDYRSVIDDLTIENKRLKAQLKRYKQFDSGVLRKEKLFEIKVHGLPRHKKRALEETLRSFAANLEGSNDGLSRRKISSKDSNRVYSSSLSHSCSVDSAYASISTRQNFSGTLLGQPSIGSLARLSEQKAEHYLEEPPEGLYSRHVPPTLSDDKQKLVVKKLEQVFTGNSTGHDFLRNQSMPWREFPNASSIISPQGSELVREAYIQCDSTGDAGRSRDNPSLFNINSNADQAESSRNGNDSGSGSGRATDNSNDSPPREHPPRQRPTWPHDLDPERVQMPSENMEYIRHLGVVLPELGTEAKWKRQDDSPDAGGWVYLSLLYNLAQLHILNVGLDFIRKAVSEKSTMLQLSQDGRMIRWRGGTERTKISSDSSGGNSQRSVSTDEDDGSGKNRQRKRQKMESPGDGFALALPNRNPSNFGPQTSGSSGNFHYKPLFGRSSSIETPLDETGSQDSYRVEDSLGKNSGGDYSPLRSCLRKKRRPDGAIIFYSGASFFTDLSGDVGGTSPVTYITSIRREQESHGDDLDRSTRERSSSASSMPYRPLTDRTKFLNDGWDIDERIAPEPTVNDTDASSELESGFTWCDDSPIAHIHAIEPTLEPSGVGRVSPEDHFAVIVTTRRLRITPGNITAKGGPSLHRVVSSDTIGRLEAISTSSIARGSKWEAREPVIEIEYLSGRIKRLKPAPTTSPAMFYPLFSTSSESDTDDNELYSDNGDFQKKKY